MPILLIRVLIIIAVNGGGEGKTLLTQMLLALTRLLGGSAQVVDADAGNRSIQHATGQGDSISWGAPPTIAPTMLAAYKDINALVIDVGANALTTGFAETLRSVCEAATAEGRLPYILIPHTPNKPGAARGADAAASSFKDCATTLVVRNDRDGSGAFGSTTTDPAISLNNLQPGFLAVRYQSPSSLEDFILNPEPGYALSSGAFAEWLSTFANQPAVSAMFGNPGPISTLQSIPKPGELQYSVRTLRNASDESLRLNHACALAKKAFLTTPPDSPAFVEIAERFQRATLRYLTQP